MTDRFESKAMECMATNDDAELFKNIATALREEAERAEKLVEMINYGIISVKETILWINAEITKLSNGESITENTACETLKKSEQKNESLTRKGIQKSKRLEDLTHLKSKLEHCLLKLSTTEK